MHQAESMTKYWKEFANPKRFMWMKQVFRYSEAPTQKRNGGCGFSEQIQTYLSCFMKVGGRYILDEILSQEYSGVVICDGWSAYKFLKNAIIQRCWAHLLRYAKEHKEDDEGKKLYEQLKLMFDEIKRFRESSPNKEARQKKYEEFTSRIESMIEKYSCFEQLKTVVTYLKNGKNDWFTCVLHLDVEPTNNFAEQTVREPVIVRKIIGAFRSENGAENYAKIASLIATWKLNGKNIKDELRGVIVDGLCFSEEGEKEKKSSND